MTREEARKAAEVMLAYADGKEIEYKDSFGNWQNSLDPNFNWSGDLESYRIKSTPTYRPFANAEECWEEMKKHEPFGWLRMKGTSNSFLIRCISSIGVVVGSNKEANTMKHVFENYTFADGTPFGKLTEEE